MRIAYLTAGAAGMYCGSCMHDNSLAKALQKQGVDCILLPIYTPTRTDEQNVSTQQVFLGGVHLYLLQRLPWLRFIPRAWRAWLDAPWLLQRVRQGKRPPKAKLLGQLTVSMLRGTHGRQRDEIDRLAVWLATGLRPETVLLTNLLIGGAIPSIRLHLPAAQVVVMLQGDDIFLDYLRPQERQQAVELMRQLVDEVDHFLCNSQFYADKMSKLLAIPADKVSVLPLALDPSPFQSPVESTQDGASPPANAGRVDATEPIRIGYFARLAPEKGLHHLVAAFLQLKEQNPGLDCQLHIAGWAAPSQAKYVHQLRQQIEAAGRQGDVEFWGSPDMAGKCRFLRNVDMLCVPTDYQEPKGRFVLEAWANGIPVIQPRHGAFPEMIQAAGGGLLFPPGDVPALTASLLELVTDSGLRKALGQAGQRYVLEQANIASQAERLVRILRHTDDARQLSG